MRVDQVLVVASPGDPVTDVALRMRVGLAEVVDTDVFALRVDPALAGRVRPLRELAGATADRVVHRLSTAPIPAGGAADVAGAVLASGRPLIVEHLGTAPPVPGDELAALAARACLGVADCGPAARQLTDAGVRRVVTTTPVTHTDRLLATSPHEPTEHHLASVVEGPVLVFVGEVSPRQGVHRLVEAFNILVSHHRPDVHLVVAGTGGGDAYRRQLRRQLLELNLADVWLLEDVDDAQLVALLQRADLLVTMSDDEGFCEPMVDAFAFGVPFVGRRVGELAGTAAGAALLLDPDDGIEVAAEAFLELLTNGRLRARLVRRGLDRARALAPEVAVRRRVELMTGPL